MNRFGDVLRGLGSVLNPQVAQQVAAEDQQKAQLAQQVGLMGLQERAANAKLERQLAAQAAENEANRKSRETLAREAAMDRAMQFEQGLEIRRGQLDLQRDALLQRAASDDDKRRVDEWYKQQSLDLQRQRQEMQARLEAMGLEIKKQIADQKGDGGGLTPENAGKVAMAQQAVEGIGTARGYLFDKDGNFNTKLAAMISTPGFAGLPLNSEARIARSALRNAIEAKLRIETGAAATESEVNRTLARFLPTALDTKESAAFKLDELEKFFKTSLSQTKGVKKTETPAGKVIDFGSLK